MLLEKKSNASRFINCYNLIDNALRAQGDMRHSISYTEAVRRAARNNGIVKKYEDELVDYGRLRNAIVHNSSDDYIIAEPHLEIVENYERLANLICTPPLAVDTVCNKNFRSLTSELTVRELIEFYYKSGNSNIPIYKKDMLIGVASANKVMKTLGKMLSEKQDIEKYINNTTIEESLRQQEEINHYTIAEETITLDKVLNLFAENRKLLIIVITKTGSLLERPIGIVSVADIMDINKILDNYL